jgi:hypothetical protein
MPSFFRLKQSLLTVVFFSNCCHLLAGSSDNQVAQRLTDGNHPASQSIIPQETAPSNRATPVRPHPQYSEAPRTVEGQFVRVISRFGPRYPIRLLDDKKKRLAYVDLSKIFIRDLRPYLNQLVKINGQVRPLVPGSEELVIIARTLQLKQGREALPFSN